MNSNRRNRNKTEETPVYDTLAGLSQAVGVCLGIPAALIPYLQNQEILQAIQDKARFQNLVNIICRDVGEMSKQYRDIQNRHAGRTGHERDTTDLMSAIQIHQDYMDWAYRFDDVVLPNVEDMLSLLRAAGASIRDLPTISAVQSAGSLPY